MIKQTLLMIGLSFVSAILYRLGGWGQDGRSRFPSLPGWFFNTKMRDFGCAIIALIAMVYVLNVQATLIIHVISAILLFITLTTYWDKYFNDTDNFWMHGFMCAFAYLPYAIVNDNWEGFLFRCIALSLLMGFWSNHIKWRKYDDIIDEMGRGFFICATLPLLLI